MQKRWSKTYKYVFAITYWSWATVYGWESQNPQFVLPRLGTTGRLRSVFTRVPGAMRRTPGRTELATATRQCNLEVGNCQPCVNDICWHMEQVPLKSQIFKFRCLPLTLGTRWRCWTTKHWPCLLLLLFISWVLREAVDGLSAWSQGA